MIAKAPKNDVAVYVEVPREFANVDGHVNFTVSLSGWLAVADEGLVVTTIDFFEKL